MAPNFQFVEAVRPTLIPAKRNFHTCRCKEI